MDRNTLLRFLLIAGVMLLALKFWPSLSGKRDSTPQPIGEEKYVNAPGFAPDTIDPVPPGQDGPNRPNEGESCTIQGNRFVAELSSRGAGLRHLYLTDATYKNSEAADMSTTPDIERWRSLRTLFRADGAADQIAFDRFDWQLEKLGNDGCQFTYKDPSVEIVKTIKADGKPFELSVETKITNLADAPKTHRFDIQTFAFRQNKEMKGHFGRVSPFLTELSCASGDTVDRKSRDDSDFKKHGWWTLDGIDRYAAISNYYFAQALVPVDPGGARPACRILAEDWYSEGQSAGDDDAAAVFHAELAYPPRTLASKETATYEQIAFFGPKEREILKDAGAGRHLGSLINLGFFSPVAKYLVGYLVFLHDHIVSSWGFAIILMTVTLRLALFPLTYRSIKSSLGMRKLKPEIDALNLKYKDDAQQKNLAMMELWRKNGVSPFGGCLPQLVQMPVWFAMYTTLQTAVEMYHTKFLWFADLSAPDKMFILPVLLGVFMILQQKIMPQQPGMDPAQQKMMMYLMPGVMTVFMLFLPAALGVYMLTNSLLGITQQLAIEQIAPSGGAGKKKTTDGDDMPVQAGGDDRGGLKLRKGKASV